uniref:Uncharacterized protein n=1 Tax=Brevundimonas basaltis TaxID=472166 RepID=A0A7W8HWQ6_9CAUL|nr:hypothetical protein [Brevundimonas basaltis]
MRDVDGVTSLLTDPQHKRRPVVLIEDDAL